MTPSVTEVPRELEGLGQAVLQALRAACAGDWRRVEVTGPGEWVIHNKPQMRRVQLPTVRPSRRRSAGARRVTPRVLAPEPSDVALTADLDPMVAAKALVEEYRRGIHDSIHIELAEYLLNMPNAVVDLGFAACRYPRSVEIDPVTVEKGPRLRFRSHDVLAVVGFTNLSLPTLLAVKLNG